MNIILHYIILLLHLTTLDHVKLWMIRMSWRKASVFLKGQYVLCKNTVNIPLIFGYMLVSEFVTVPGHPQI